MFYASKSLGLEFCSFFWMQYFFAYEEFNKRFDVLPYRTAMRFLNIDAYNNMLEGKHAETGEHFRAISSK